MQEENAFLLEKCPFFGSGGKKSFLDGNRLRGNKICVEIEPLQFLHNLNELSFFTNSVAETGKNTLFVREIAFLATTKFPFAG